MSDANKVTDPNTNGQSETPKNDPAPSTAGQSNPSTQEPVSLPEKFKGKSAEDIAKAYIELESEHGKTTKQIAENKELRQNMEIVLSAIKSDPALLKNVSDKVDEIQGIKPRAGAANDGGAQPTKVDDVRLSEQNRTISEFEKTYKLDQLPAEKRSQANQAITRNLAELLDPTGEKPLAQTLNEVRLDKLPQLLEKAFWLANKDALVDKGPLSAEFGSIGSMSSNGGKAGDQNNLTEIELKTAKKLGISPEKYASKKKQIFEQNK